MIILLLVFVLFGLVTMLSLAIIATKIKEQEHTIQRLLKQVLGLAGNVLILTLNAKIEQGVRQQKHRKTAK